MAKPIRKVVVLGASSAGLLSAIALKHFFPQLSVVLLHSPRHLPIGVGESTTAWIPQFLHDYLKISKQEFMAAVWPVWKLGIRFEWGSSQTSHFNYTFDNQFSYDTPSLTQSPGFYCMHDMRQASRFSILMDKLHAPMWRNPQGDIEVVPEGFGYHLDIREFSTFLFKKAVALGVEVRELEVLDASRNGSGDIDQLICGQNEQIQADLFFDCSGFQSKLLGKILQENFISYQDRLFCDSAIVGSWQRESPIFPFTTATTFKSGWRWRIDLRDRISLGYVYSSQFCSQDEALQELVSSIPQTIEGIRQLTFRSGRYQRFWANNVIAIGNAAGFVEPLESTGQHMIAETIWRVILALKDSHLIPSPKLVSATNFYIGDLWDEICDFLTLHFKFNHRLDTPFWKHCRAETDLGALQELVELYQEAGVCRAIVHLIPQSSIFETEGYLTLLCGQRLPIKHLRAITLAEQTEWNLYRKRLWQDVEYSFDPRQAMHILNRIALKPS